MSKDKLNDFERRLLEHVRTDGDVIRYRRTAIKNSIFYSILFAMAVKMMDGKAFDTKMCSMIAGILAVYSLLSCMAVVNFQRALNAYRSILEKLSGTPVEECPEKQSKINMILLTVFFWCILLAIILLDLSGKQYYLAGGFAFFMLLSAGIKYRYAGIVIDYKHRCAKLTK
ncbi:MAG: hypothetical protein IKB16_16115 [Lentisphaeria bacterium]|nr:hypothetical protein [Lentisphaeria bacterium]